MKLIKKAQKPFYSQEAVGVISWILYKIDYLIGFFYNKWKNAFTVKYLAWFFRKQVEQMIDSYDYKIS